MPIAAGHNHFTSYNRRRILNDVPIIKRIEDQLPYVVTRFGSSENQGANTPMANNSNNNANPCCVALNRELSMAASREQKHLGEIEHLKTKLKSKSKRYKEKLEEKEKEHQSELESRDKEIERLKAELEAAKRLQKKEEESEEKSKATTTTTSKDDRRGRKTYRRSSWSERSTRRQSSANTRKSNNSLRGLRSWAKLHPGFVPNSNKTVAFAAGGQKPSKSDLQ